MPRNKFAHFFLPSFPPTFLPLSLLPSQKSSNGQLNVTTLARLLSPQLTSSRAS